MATGAPIPMPIEPGLALLFQWLSPGFPVGAFAYSHGLETAVQRGDIHDADGFHDWLSDILRHGGAWCDAVLLAAAWHAGSAAEHDEIDAVALALAPSRERLSETTLQGAAFAGTAASVWGGDPRARAYPVSVGRAARHHGIALTPTLHLFLHAFAANLVSAAQRLVPLGQTEAQSVLAALAPLIGDVAQAAETSAIGDVGTACFLADITSMQHETQYSRLFRS